MDDTSTGDHDSPSTPSPSAPRNTEPRFDVMYALETEIAVLRREKEYVLQKLSRNGQGTVSNIEAITDRTVRQRNELRAENQGLRVVIEHLKSDIIDLQGNIARIQDKLDRAEGERTEMIQSRRRWIARIWALAGRVPGELRKKDAEIENMREKLVDMHARLAQGQSQLRERQGQLDEERTKRIGVEVELGEERAAHTQRTEAWDMTKQRLGDQLKRLANSLDSNTVSI
jgi:chromosome segregation ATPase